MLVLQYYSQNKFHETDISVHTIFKLKEIRQLLKRHCFVKRQSRQSLGTRSKNVQSRQLQEQRRAKAGFSLKANNKQ
jgi:hypothetical protein